ncbi:hypothetical protein [Escherichia coli]|uniref:hypothetical protein n=1 Tax=Escherichia coli TaxID=562 RepID=UPI000AB33A3F|nr:hypothetical protein [Escherichia coli]
MEITKERLLEIANLSERALSDGRIISPDAYESVTSIEIITMARMLLGCLKKEYKKRWIAMLIYMIFWTVGGLGLQLEIVLSTGSKWLINIKM